MIGKEQRDGKEHETAVKNRADREDDLVSPAKNPDLIETRRQQIVEGGCRLFFEKGFHPTTVREIAEACNMSMGQLYHYISSKDDILYLAYKWLDRIVAERAAKIAKLESDDRDPLKTFRAVLELTLQTMLENQELVRFIFTETKHMEKKRMRTVLAMDSEVVHGWQDLLKKIGQQTSLNIDLDFAANIISYLLDFIALRGWNLKKRSPEENSKLLVDFILAGLGLTKQTS